MRSHVPESWHVTMCRPAESCHTVLLIRKTPDRNGVALLQLATHEAAWPTDTDAMAQTVLAPTDHKGLYVTLCQNKAPDHFDSRVKGWQDCQARITTVVV